MLVSVVKARVRVDLRFYSLMNNIEFISQWCLKMLTILDCIHAY